MANRLGNLTNADRIFIEGTTIGDKTHDIEMYRAIIDMLKELKIMNIHLASITDIDVTKEELG
jgi:hypothetical protein